MRFSSLVVDSNFVTSFRDLIPALRTPTDAFPTPPSNDNATLFKSVHHNVDKTCAIQNNMTNPLLA